MKFSLRIALALRYAATLAAGALDSLDRSVLADLLRAGAASPSTVALTNGITAAARSLASGATDIAAELTAWRDLVVLYIGDTPAARAASEDDTRKWVRGQLNELAEKRAELRLERAKNRNLAHRVRVAAQMINDAESGLEDHILRAAEDLDLEEHEAMQSRVDQGLVGAGLLDPIVEAALSRAGEAVPRG